MWSKKKIGIVDWLFLSRAPRLYRDYACTLRINCGELLIIERKQNKGTRVYSQN